jgi:hypothetical protein
VNDYSGSDRHSARAMCCCRVSATLVKSSSTDLSLLDSRWSGIGSSLSAFGCSSGTRRQSKFSGSLRRSQRGKRTLFAPANIPLDEIGQKLWLRMIRRQFAGRENPIAIVFQELTEAQVHVQPRLSDSFRAHMYRNQRQRRGSKNGEHVGMSKPESTMRSLLPAICVISGTGNDLRRAGTLQALVLKPAQSRPRATRPASLTISRESRSRVTSAEICCNPALAFALPC